MALTISGSGGGITASEALNMTGWNVVAQTSVDFTKNSRHPTLFTWSSFINASDFDPYMEFRFRFQVTTLNYSETSPYSDRYGVLLPVNWATSSDAYGLCTPYALFRIKGAKTVSNWSGTLVTAPFRKLLTELSEPAFSFDHYSTSSMVYAFSDTKLTFCMYAVDATCNFQGTLYLEGRK